MMPCLLVVLAIFAPRLVIVLLWLFSSWFQGLYDVILWPILGFVLLPTTLLWHSMVLQWFGGRWSLLTVIGLLAALALDLSPAAARRPAREAR